MSYITYKCPTSRRRVRFNFDPFVTSIPQLLCLCSDCIIRWRFKVESYYHSQVYRLSLENYRLSRTNEPNTQSDSEIDADNEQEDDATTVSMNESLTFENDELDDADDDDEDNYDGEDDDDDLSTNSVIILLTPADSKRQYETNNNNNNNNNVNKRLKISIN